MDVGQSRNYPLAAINQNGRHFYEKLLFFMCIAAVWDFEKRLQVLYCGQTLPNLVNMIRIRIRTRVYDVNKSRDHKIAAAIVGKTAVVFRQLKDNYHSVLNQRFSGHSGSISIGWPW